MTEHTTRRNPEMERFVVIRPKDGGYQVTLKVRVQSFDLGIPFETLPEAEWYRDMFCIALANLCKEMNG